MQEQQTRFAVSNFALGAAISALLVLLLVYGLAGLLGAPLAVMLGAAFTARRARQRNSQPLPEGISAGLTGSTPIVIDQAHMVLVAPEATLFVIAYVAIVLLLSTGAALIGARLGSRHGPFMF